MGLCKCEQRKVTTLFCFEHRVNVCDHCAVSTHKRCIIKSYLNWLQDSDYSPVCELCKQGLGDESLGECVRLLCFDIFHWSCLNKWAASLPANTAPAGYSCPTCRTEIFPPSNNISPVATCLRELLSTVSWSQIGLDLPLLHDSSMRNGNMEAQQHRTPKPIQSFVTSTNGNLLPKSMPIATIDEGGLHVRGGGMDTSGISLSLDSLPGPEERPMDASPRLHYDDSLTRKYRRRSPLQFLGQFLSLSSAGGGVHASARAASGRRHIVMLVILAAMGVATLLYFGASFGRSVADSDPMLDPRANPHIRVQSHLP